MIILIETSISMKLSLAKASIGILLLSIPLNFIVISGLGNVYLSTILIYTLFISLLLFTDGGIIENKPAIWGILIFLLLFVFTVVNVGFQGTQTIKSNLVSTIVYLQGILVFIISYYCLNTLNRDFVFRMFLLVAFLASTRMIIENSSNLFNLSTVRGERIEANFAGAVNNFAILMGVALIIAFFHIQNKFFKVLLSFYLLIVIVLTMSRGALLGIVLTFLSIALYDVNIRTLKRLLGVALVLLVVGTFGLYFFDKADLVFEIIKERFIGVVTGEVNAKQFVSGRGIILADLYNNHFRHSNLLEILFGHGMGSINFSVNGSPYESSHNLFMDVLYRNGLVFLVLYLFLFIFLLLKFIKNRNRNNFIMFGVFVFLHLELLVNPFLFSVQIGWVHTFFLAMFLIHFKNSYLPLQIEKQ